MKKKTLTIGFTFTVLVLAVAGYYVFYRSPSPAPGTTAKLTVGYLPIADCSQLFVGLEKGFFREQGIEIEAISFSSGVKILQALGTGDVDIAFSAVVPLTLAKARGLDFVALTGGPAEDALHAEHAILVAKDSPIKSPRDLEGKAIAIVAFRSIDEPFVKEWLARNRVDVDSVTFLEIPFPQMETTLLSGHVDAIAAIEPFVTAARLNGQTRVLALNYVEVQPLTEIASYNAREEWVHNNHDVARRFQRAIDQATAFANEDPDAVRQLMPKYTNLAPELVQEVTLPLFSARLSEDRLRAILDLMLKWNLLDESIKVDTLIWEPRE